MNHLRLAAFGRAGRRIERTVAWVLAAVVFCMTPNPAAAIAVAATVSCPDRGELVSADLEQADSHAPETPLAPETADEDDEGESAPELSDDVLSHDQDLSWFTAGDRVRLSVHGGARPAFVSPQPRPSGTN